MRRVANGSFNIEINTANEEAFDALGDDVAADDEAGNEKISFTATVCKVVDFSLPLIILREINLEDAWFSKSMLNKAWFWTKYKKLISRKIWVVGKFKNLQTVRWQQLPQNLMNRILCLLPETTKTLILHRGV